MQERIAGNHHELLRGLAVHLYGWNAMKHLRVVALAAEFNVIAEPIDDFPLVESGPHQARALPTPAEGSTEGATDMTGNETNAMGKCADCRFFINGDECRRYAPRGGLGYLAYHYGDVLVDIAWSLRVLAQHADKGDVEALSEVTGGQMMTRWPRVEPHDGCGEFQEK